jgi:hypothetical protein
MNNTLHTPAPWNLEAVKSYLLHEDTGIDTGHPESLANARLIAAAPDLLSALQDICAMIVSPNDTRADILAHARAVISKATGEA